MVVKSFIGMARGGTCFIKLFTVVINYIPLKARVFVIAILV